MSKHRNPRPTVPKVPLHNNADPSAALEQLYREIIPLEATARAASDAADEMPYFPPGLDRRNMARLYALVTRVGNQAEALLERSETMVDSLSGSASREPG
jgi:hypothetical protein